MLFVEATVINIIDFGIEAASSEIVGVQAWIATQAFAVKAQMVK